MSSQLLITRRRMATLLAMFSPFLPPMSFAARRTEPGSPMAAPGAEVGGI